MIRVLCSATCPGAYADLQWTKDEKQPIYLREFAHGAVVSMREMNGYDDSDFYATFYNPETDAFEEICYASTRGWTYPANADIDATPEIFALWESRIKEQREKARQAAIEREAALPIKGRTVRILANRGKAKDHIGQEGVVFWNEERRSKFGTWSYGFRVGVRFPDGERRFLSADKVEVVRTA